MTAAVTNELEITYDDFVMGGTTDNLIVGPWRLEWGASKGGTFRRAVVEFEVLVSGSSEAAFITARQTLETKLSKPLQKVKVKLGSTTHIDADPASNTGFNAQPKVQDRGDEFDTGRTRLYTVRIEVDLPTLLDNGLGDFAFEVRFSPAQRRTVTFRGTYNAVGANSAIVQFNAQFPTKATAILNALPASPLTGLSGSNAKFEVVSDLDSIDYDGKTCKFTRVYEEVVFNESVGVLADSQIRSQTLKITRADIGPGDAPPLAAAKGSSLFIDASAALRPTQVTINYEAWIATTTGLVSVWNAKIQPYLLQVIATYAAGLLAIVELTPTFDGPNNRVTAVLRAWAVNARIISAKFAVDDEFDYGVGVDSVWDDPLAAEVGQGAAQLRRVVRRTLEVVGPNPLLGDTPNVPKLASSGWVPLGRKQSTERDRVGLVATGKQIEITRVIDVELLRFVKTPTGAQNPNKTVTFSGLNVNPAPQPGGGDSGGSTSSTPGAPDPVRTATGLNS